MQPISIDIICPVYNASAYLKECILSVINQSYKNWNLILINDGSTDNSLEICNEFAENFHNIKVINKSNEGQGIARNLGIKEGSGDYITFLDSDDYLKNDYLSNLVQILTDNPCDVLCHNVNFINDSKSWTISFYKKPIIKVSNPFEIFLTDGKIFTGACAKIISRKFIIEHELLFPAFRAREDTYFLAKLFSENPKTIFSNVSGYVVRIHENSTETSSFSFNKTYLLESSEFCVDFVKDKRPQLLDLAVEHHLNTCIVVALEMPVEVRDEDEKAYNKIVDSFNKFAHLSKDKKVIKDFELFQKNRAKFFKKYERKEFISKVKGKLWRK